MDNSQDRATELPNYPVGGLAKSSKLRFISLNGILQMYRVVNKWINSQGQSDNRIKMLRRTQFMGRGYMMFHTHAHLSWHMRDMIS